MISKINFNLTQLFKNTTSVTNIPVLTAYNKKAQQNVRLGFMNLFSPLIEYISNLFTLMKEDALQRLAVEVPIFDPSVIYLFFFLFCGIIFVNIIYIFYSQPLYFYNKDIPFDESLIRFNRQLLFVAVIFEIFALFTMLLIVFLVAGLHVLIVFILFKPNKGTPYFIYDCEKKLGGQVIFVNQNKVNEYAVNFNVPHTCKTDGIKNKSKTVTLLSAQYYPLDINIICFLHKYHLELSLLYPYSVLHGFNMSVETLHPVDKFHLQQSLKKIRADIL